MAIPAASDQTPPPRPAQRDTAQHHGGRQGDDERAARSSSDRAVLVEGRIVRKGAHQQVRDSGRQQERRHEDRPPAWPEDPPQPDGKDDHKEGRPAIVKGVEELRVGGAFLTQQPVRPEQDHQEVRAVLNPGIPEREDTAPPEDCQDRPCDTGQGDQRAIDASERWRGGSQSHPLPRGIVS